MIKDLSLLLLYKNQRIQVVEKFGMLLIELFVVAGYDYCLVANFQFTICYLYGTLYSLSGHRYPWLITFLLQCSNTLDI